LFGIQYAVPGTLLAALFDGTFQAAQQATYWFSTAFTVELIYETALGHTTNLTFAMLFNKIMTA